MDRLKKEKGFTLLEVMVTMSILAIGLLGVIGMYITSIGGNAQGRSVTEAATVAQSKLEELSNKTVYGSLTNGSETTAVPDGGTYNVTWTVMSSFGALQMKRIDLTATWTKNGQPHQVQFSTLRAKDK